MPRLKDTQIEIKDVPARFQYLCTLLVSSMGLPMSLPFRLNSGSKYSSAVMAVGLWGLAHWDTWLWKNEQSVQWRSKIHNIYKVLILYIHDTWGGGCFWEAQHRINQKKEIKLYSITNVDKCFMLVFVQTNLNTSKGRYFPHAVLPNNLMTRNLV